MWLNLLVLLMLVLITFFQGLQGLFSATILLVLSVISMVVAFGFYEDLYSGLLAQWLPGAGEAVSLMLLFLGTLIVLRLIVDLGIKGNVKIPRNLDRIGGGAVAFFAAMVLTGVAMTAVQMLPAERHVLGFARFNEVNGSVVEKGLWFGPDRFAVGLSRVILDGGFSAKASREGKFQEVHPDLLAELDARRSAGVPRPVKPGELSLKVDQVWFPDQIRPADGKELIPPRSGRFVGVRVDQSGPLPKAFTPQQMRLVVTRGSSVEAHPAVAAGLDTAAPIPVEPLSIYKMQSGAMNLVYEVPTGADAWYVTFDGRSRGEVTKSEPDDQKTPSFTAQPQAAPQSTPQPQPQARQPQDVRNPGGRTHGANVAEQPIVSDNLPEGIAIARNEIATSATLAGSKLRDGHFALPMSKTSRVKMMGMVSQFDVPDGQRLVQVPLHRVMPGSLAGQAIDFTVRTLQQQWALVDDTGGKYLPVGAVAIANVGGEETVEIQYHIGQANIAAGRTLRPWQRISDQALRNQPDAKLVFLYLVPPRRHLVNFDTGRRQAEIDVTVQ